MKNFNQIPDYFLEEFSKSNLGMSLNDKNFRLVQNYSASVEKISPREIATIKILPVDSFYYINFLLENNPNVIYDIGCGCNFWKEFFPNTIGLDPLDELADIKDYFDEDYCRNHQEYFDAVIAVCSLHFISLDNFSKALSQLHSTLKENARAYVTFNLARMIEKTSLDELTKLNYRPLTPHNPLSYEFLKSVDLYIRNSLKELNYNFICVDIDFEKYRYDAPMDGNIRLVFQK